MKFPRSVLILAVLAFGIRLVIFGAIYTAEGAEGFLVSDSENFIQVAENIRAGHGFTKSVSEPYIPNAKFPPLYTLLVAGSLGLGSTIPLVLLQALMAAAFPVLVYLIAMRLFMSHRVALIAAAFMGLEPVIAIFSLLVLSDTVTLFFLLLAVHAGLSALDERRLHEAAYAGLFLGLSTLTRPHGQYLFLAALVLGLLWLVSRNGSGHLRERSAMLAVFAAVFLVVLAPWLLRNYLRFDTVSLSSTGLRNLYVDFAPSIVLLETGEPYKAVEHRLNREFMEQYGIAEEQALYEDPSLGGRLATEGLRIAARHPRATAKMLGIVLASFFTQDLYFYYAYNFGLTRGANIDFSPSLVLVGEGPGALLRMVWDRAGPYAFLGLIGRGLWVLVTLGMLIGAARGFFAGGRVRTATLFVVLVVLFYAATSLVAGFSDQGRFRYPADPFILMLAAYGVVGFYSNRRLSALPVS